MTYRYMLDTDVVSFVAKRRPAIYLDRMSVLPPDDICISAITEAELLLGLLKLPDEDRRQRTVRQILTELHVLPWERGCAAHYAEIEHYLTRTGQRIGEMDTLIAAHALSLGVTLVTHNVRHHGRVPGLTVVDWGA